MGEAYAAAGQYAESVKYLRRAIAIVETYEIESNCDVRYPAAGVRLRLCMELINNPIFHHCHTAPTVWVNRRRLLLLVVHGLPGVAPLRGGAAVPSVGGVHPGVHGGQRRERALAPPPCHPAVQINSHALHAGSNDPQLTPCPTRSQPSEYQLRAEMSKLRHTKVAPPPPAPLSRAAGTSAAAPGAKSAAAS